MPGAVWGCNLHRPAPWTLKLFSRWPPHCSFLQLRRVQRGRTTTLHGLKQCVWFYTRLGKTAAVFEDVCTQAWSLHQIYWCKSCLRFPWLPSYCLGDRHQHLVAPQKQRSLQCCWSLSLIDQRQLSQWALHHTQNAHRVTKPHLCWEQHLPKSLLLVKALQKHLVQ